LLVTLFIAVTLSCELKTLSKPIYNEICDKIENIYNRYPQDAPFFIRLAWHSSGTYDMHKSGYRYGSKGGTLHFPKEQADGANAGLANAVKGLQSLKNQYAWLSYGDLYTLAGAVGIAWAGGPQINWKDGRCDAPSDTWTPSPGNLPDAFKQGDKDPKFPTTMAGVKTIFTRMGFNYQEIVALIGAHTLGECHANFSGYLGPWTTQPHNFTNEFFVLLTGVEWSLGVAPNGDPQYNWNGLMMLPSDFGLLADPDFSPYVQKYANDQDAFFADFKPAFEKLITLGVSDPCPWSPCACSKPPQ